MKKFFLVISLSLALLMPSFALGQRGHHSNSTSNSSSHTSKKSNKAGSNDGTYQRGSGSSHKGGHYKNQNTGDHYRNRKGGTPK